MPGENSTYPVESGICRNLRYSLDQLKIAGEKETYMKLVDSVLVGPETVKQSDVEDILGVNMDIFKRSIKKRNDLVLRGFRPSWKTEDSYHSTTPSNPRDGRPHIPQDRSPRLGQRSEYQTKDPGFLEKAGSSFPI